MIKMMSTISDDDDAEKHEFMEDTQEEKMMLTIYDIMMVIDFLSHQSSLTMMMKIYPSKRILKKVDSSISSSDEEDNDNDVEGANVASAKSDEDATDEKDQGRDKVRKGTRFYQLLSSETSTNDKQESLPVQDHQEFEYSVQMNKPEEEGSTFLMVVQTYEITLQNHAWNSLLLLFMKLSNCWSTFELMKALARVWTELVYFVRTVYKPHREIRLDQPEGRQYPHDLRQTTTVRFKFSRSSSVLLQFIIFINNGPWISSGGRFVSRRKFSTSVKKDLRLQITGHFKRIDVLVPNSMWSQNDLQIWTNSPLWVSRFGERATTVLCICKP
ncbi:hypothetical protein Tco_1508850 [Tanacetum coccineum]